MNNNFKKTIADMTSKWDLKKVSELIAIATINPNLISEEESSFILTQGKIVMRDAIAVQAIAREISIKNGIEITHEDLRNMLSPSGLSVR